MPDGDRKRIGAAMIRKAATEILLEVGLMAATTRAVTDRAQVGRGLLNHYFSWPELRASAWESIFTEVSAEQFSPGMPPDAALEHYLATGFHPQARVLWRLWLEATDLAGSDALMAETLKRVNLAMIGAMQECLANGARQGLWLVADPAGTALRISALYDGLAGLLLAGTADLTPSEAERHLRHAVRLELG